jgi:hypothetical protein
MFTTLICEGVCNHGRVHRLDEAIARYREKVPGGPIIDLGLIAQLRALEHTPHLASENHWDYTCVECGTSRTFGIPPRGLVRSFVVSGQDQW